MDPVLFPLLAFFTMGAIVAGSIVLGRKTMQSDTVADIDWRESISKRGFTKQAPGDYEKERWIGNFEGLPASVVVRTAGDNSVVETSLEVPGPLPAGFALGAFGGVGFSVMADGFRTGHDEFDSLVAVRGSERDAPAWLDHEVRAAVLECLVYTGFRLEDGRVLLWQMGLNSNDDLLPILQRLARLARALSTGGPIEDRLARIASDDNEPGRLRERCARLLFESHPGSAAARGVAARLLRESIDADLRLLGCTVLLDEDEAPLRQFVLADRHPGPLRTRGLEVLHARGKADAAFLDQVIRVADGATAALAIRVVVDGRRTEFIEVLRIAAADPHRAGGAAAAALAVLDDYGAAPILTRAVSNLSDDIERALPYVAALEKLGQIDAVAALRALRPGFGEGDAKQAIADAIAAIQDRAGRPDAGRLSVVDDGSERGNLSVVDDS